MISPFSKKTIAVKNFQFLIVFKMKSFFVTAAIHNLEKVVN